MRPDNIITIGHRTALTNKKKPIPQSTTKGPEMTNVLKSTKLKSLKSDIAIILQVFFFGYILGFHIFGFGR